MYGWGYVILGETVTWIKLSPLLPPALLLVFLFPTTFVMHMQALIQMFIPVLLFSLVSTVP